MIEKNSVLNVAMPDFREHGKWAYLTIDYRKTIAQTAVIGTNGRGKHLVIQ
jgi:hypothetical protein